jgi:hypothetical protein
VQQKHIIAHARVLAGAAAPPSPSMVARDACW